MIFYAVSEKYGDVIFKILLNNGFDKEISALRSFQGSKFVSHKKIEPDCREGVLAQLERMKELCKERNNLYEKQTDLKGQKWKIEKSLER